MRTSKEGQKSNSHTQKNPCILKGILQQRCRYKCDIFSCYISRRESNIGVWQCRHVARGTLLSGHGANIQSGHDQRVMSECNGVDAEDGHKRGS